MTIEILGNAKDLTGLKVGKLVVIKPTKLDKDKHLMWLCKCSCGNSKVIVSNSLTRATPVKSCGCLIKDAAKLRVKKQGAWNEGKSYAIGGGNHCYKTRHAWAIAAIRKFGNKCQICGWNKAKCDVHHKIEKSIGGLNTLENAKVLCPNCHREIHEL